MTIYDLSYNSDLSSYLHNYVRVMYSMVNAETGMATNPEAVLCSELYADEIKNELENVPPSYQQFQRTFNNSAVWICPNITDRVTIDKDHYFVASLVPC